MDLTSYLKLISKFQLLTKEEEQELFKKVRSGDEKAREQAITANLRLVINIAKKYLHTRVPFQDLVQEGNSGLIIAVDKFDPDRDRRFSTYATFWIKQAVLRYLNDTKNIIRYPSYVVDYINRISKTILEFRNKESKTPSPEQIAKSTDIPVKEVRRILELMDTAYVSLDEQYECGQNIDPKKRTVEDNMCQDFESESLVDMVKKLRGKEQEVIVHRFGLFGNEKLTLEKVAERLDLTRERVRQIQNSVVAKLRDRIKNL